MYFVSKNQSGRHARVLALCLAGCVSASWAFEAEFEASSPHATVQWAGAIESTRLNESSGLAASQRHADVLWSMNDSGGNAELFALSTSGKHLGSWMLDMPKPLDWEAMTSFIWEQKPYLLVADIGDNFARRDQVSYTIIPEPDIQTLAPDTRLTPTQTQTFTYPDGPKDSEAIAVDAARSELLVLSKRTQPPRLYRLPLNIGEKGRGASDTWPVQTAEKIGSLSGFEKPDMATVDLYGDAWSYLAMPTGMSLFGDRLLVTTLEDAFLFDRRSLAAPLQRVSLPYIGQREAITFAGGAGKVAYVTHERQYGMRHAHLLRVLLIPTESLPHEAIGTR